MYIANINKYILNLMSSIIEEASSNYLFLNFHFLSLNSLNERYNYAPPSYTAINITKNLHIFSSEIQAKTSYSCI